MLQPLYSRKAKGQSASLNEQQQLAWRAQVLVLVERLQDLQRNSDDTTILPDDPTTSQIIPVLTLFFNVSERSTLSDEIFHNYVA